MTRSSSPLCGPPPSEVPLGSAPLIRVIAQVRFPPILSVGQREYIAAFQEAIRVRYPVLRPSQARTFVFSSNGVAEDRMSTNWRFLDASGDWMVTLGPEFLAIEASRYTSRDDFLRRFEEVLRALEDHVAPGFIDRLGVRYIDRIQGKNLQEINKLIRSEVAGILATPLHASARYAIAENEFSLVEDPFKLRTRWGLVPEGITVDPAAIDVVDRPSWLLDLDAFQSNFESREWDTHTLVNSARRMCERIYSMFRWVVSDEFLKRYGEKI